MSEMSPQPEEPQAGTAQSGVPQGVPQPGVRQPGAAQTPRSGAPLESVPGGAPRKLTSGTLTLGVAIATGCFLIAGVAEVAGVDAPAGDMTDIGSLINGVFAIAPWAWASLGTLAVVVTPAVGLLVTAHEYASVSDRRTMWLALAVLAVLIVSATIAVLR